MLHLASILKKMISRYLSIFSVRERPTSRVSWHKRALIFRFCGGKDLHVRLVV